MNIPEKYLEKALMWRERHKAHVDALVKVADEAYTPSGSDVLSPELWKAAHWAWLYQLKNLKPSSPGHPHETPSPSDQPHFEAQLKASIWMWKLRALALALFSFALIGLAPALGSLGRLAPLIVSFVGFFTAAMSVALLISLKMNPTKTSRWPFAFGFSAIIIATITIAALFTAL